MKKELEIKAQKPNKVRHACAEISLAKFEYIFRNEPPKSLSELQQIVGPLLQKYHAYLKMDEKPEKGDRKMADEMVLLIADVIDSYLTKGTAQGDPVDKGEKLKLHLFKSCLLELAYEHSNYNFDMQISLMKSYDQLGLSVSYAEAFETLGIKGVQLETLGYLRTHHPMKWLNYSQFTTSHNKYFKYLRFNAKEMGDIKLLAATQKNFGQLENFIEYESYLSKSYFTYFAHEFFNKTRLSLN